MNPRELLVALIKHGGGISRARMQAKGTAGRFGSQRAHLPRGTRDDPRDEEDVGTDLDFSKYTRDRVDYESGGNTCDLWAAIYRPRIGRSARINANYEAQLSKSRLSSGAHICRRRGAHLRKPRRAR